MDYSAFCTMNKKVEAQRVSNGLCLWRIDKVFGDMVELKPKHYDSPKVCDAISNVIWQVKKGEISITNPSIIKSQIEKL